MIYTCKHTNFETIKKIDKGRFFIYDDSILVSLSKSIFFKGLLSFNTYTLGK